MFVEVCEFVAGGPVHATPERHFEVADCKINFDLTVNPIVCSIETLEGTMTAIASDWIIKGVKGEFYPCKPDIFAATYEPAENE